MNSRRTPAGEVKDAREAATRPGGLVRHLAVCLVISVLGYLALYQVDGHLRTRRGPWVARFTAEPGDVPTLTIEQARLGIAGVRLRFTGGPASDRSLDETIEFNHPGQRLPYGRLVFEDLTYLPGTVTLEVLGHEIELIPRTLYVDRKERGWQSQTTLDLPAKGGTWALKPDGGLNVR